MIPRIIDTIDGVDVVLGADERLTFLAGMQIDADGSGPSYGDPDYQNDTTLHWGGEALNCDVDKWIVLPPQLILGVKGIVLGCQVQVLNGANGLSSFAVVGDIGPMMKLGEGSVALARALDIPWSPINGGTSSRNIRYSIMPGVPAIVGGKQYLLQPYAP